jgi:S4 domain protein YaaA
MEKIRIHTDYITLGQLLKKADVVQSGGEVKQLLLTESVRVNQEIEVRRGRKLYPQDLVEVEGIGHFLISSS